MKGTFDPLLYFFQEEERQLRQKNRETEQSRGHFPGMLSDGKDKNGMPAGGEDENGIPVWGPPAWQNKAGFSPAGGEAFRLLARQVRERLRQEEGSRLALALIDAVSREKLKDCIARIVASEGLRLPEFSQGELTRRLQEELLFYGPIQPALDDSQVTNIDINTYRDVYLEKNGREEYHPELGFESEAHLEVMLNKMLMAGGKVLTANEPHIDSLFEKYRICAVLGTDRGGLAAEGTCASIRKFSEKAVTPEDLMAMGTISGEMDAFFRQVLPYCNCIIAGATNSGKTTTLMAMPLYFDKDTRIITIEDSPELMLRRRSGYREYHNIVALQAKDHENQEKRFDIARLTKVSLRMRPVKVIIGEVRDAQSCRQAHESMNTGHSTYFTIHASSAANAATRIVQLAGDGYNDEIVAAQLAATVDLIIFQQKLGRRRIITEVAELIGYEEAKKPLCRSIFRFRQEGVDAAGEVTGSHRRCGGISGELAEKLLGGLADPDQVRHWQDRENAGASMEGTGEAAEPWKGLLPDIPVKPWRAGEREEGVC